ncbi:hypothetical protein BJ170DRAFT_149402 [Xylariales sp. AK1849]|nr:hypothetical protein BJ170DRAFT_149402 [Xylariales sp. AK1849]
MKPSTPSAESNPSRRSRLIENWTRAFTAVSDIVSTERRPSLKTQATTLGQTIQQVVDDGWTTRHHSRYREVRVLLSYFAETDDSGFGADKAAQRLADVFKRRFGFDVQIWLIPIMDPQGSCAQKLSEFVSNDGKAGNLLIFWYGGFAKGSEDGKGPVMWFGDRWGGQVDSRIVPQILGAGKADVLTLYDCGLSLHGHGGLGAGIFEHLGASPNENVWGFGNSRSFTKSLIQIIDQPEIAACGISMLDIHRKLVNRARRLRTIPEDDGKKATSRGHAVSAARSWLSSSTTRSPVYCHLSTCPPRGRRVATSIVLSRIGYPLEVFGYDNEGEELNVDLRLRLKKNDIDLRVWKEWITPAPPEVDQVSIRIT